MYSVNLKKIEQHAAHTPRKRWRCGSACAAGANLPFEILRFACFKIDKA
jgi:hypothetical protein